MMHFCIQSGLWVPRELYMYQDTIECMYMYYISISCIFSFSDWFKAVQGLMSCAVASSMLALLIGLLSLCNACKGCNAHQAAGAFANLTCKFGRKRYEKTKGAINNEQSRSRDTGNIGHTKQ